MGENKKPVKRYYWLKLKEDFFHDKEIKKLRRIAGGDTYTVIYLKLMLLSLKSDGRLYYDGVEDSFCEELALEIDESPDNVKVTLMYLEKLKLTKIVSEEELYLTQMDNLIASESESAQRVREHRARKKLLELEHDDLKAIEVETNLLQDTSVEKINTSDNEKSRKQKHLEEINEFFESLWKLYIRKEGKSAVTKAAKEEIFNIGYDRMAKCIQNYIKQKEGTERKYLLMGSTFFNGRYKDYLDDEDEHVSCPTNNGQIRRTLQ